eukprot:CAMPEP_0175169632 /NCGR_PEP_ID=MMETSP0087-20121206/29720_1 /TAXON_ID=136419 /ORGANISM="Unknown Unknown, Strain D1" /LENGTH=187 /DNA_ID=CAMNT_0016460083 /DNA_START=513 /DNA_END=1072 /DNA_ORIENTATION=-
MIQKPLADWVYRPLRRAGLSRGTSVVGAFACSGFIHAYPLAFGLHRTQQQQVEEQRQSPVMAAASVMLFFLVQASCLLLESVLLPLLLRTRIATAPKSSTANSFSAVSGVTSNISVAAKANTTTTATTASIRNRTLASAVTSEVHSATSSKATPGRECNLVGRCLGRIWIVIVLVGTSPLLLGPFAG